MRPNRALLFGFSFTALALVLNIGSLLAAIAENSSGATSSPFSNSPTPAPTRLTFLPTPSPTLTQTATPTEPPTQIPCQPPEGWTAVVVQPGDSLESFASDYQVDPERLMDANCLPDETLTPGMVLYIPAIIPITTGTPTLTVSCGPPAGWIEYTVLPGDSLFQLSVDYSVSVEEIQNANCMGSSTLLQAGSIIYLPDVSESTSPG